MNLLEASSVLFVHAHPDDETIGSGVIIAELVRRGTPVSLLTATRGEQGEVVAGPLSNLEGTPELVRQRERELECACERLGIARPLWLGTPPARVAGLPPRNYEDSGMRWLREGLAGPAENVGIAAFTSAPFGEVVDDLAAAIRHVQPKLVVSYDETGGYGHPDHVLVHHAALAACERLGVPFAELVLARGDDVEWFELPEHLETVLDALGCFTTQLTIDGTDIIHSGGQRQAVFTAMGLRARH